MKFLVLLLSLGAASGLFAPATGNAAMAVRTPAAVTMMAAKVAKKPVKMARVTKKVVAKKVVKKVVAKKVVKKVVAKKVVKKVVARKVVKKAPAKKAAPVKSGTFAFGLPGNINVVGGEELNFDPYGFLKGKSKLEVYRYRECELAHGRVGMLAAVGFIVQESFHPLFSGVGGPAIDQLPQLPFAWYASLGLGITFCEFYRISIAFRELSKKTGEPTTIVAGPSALRPGYEPGQIGFDPLGLAPTDPKEFRLMQEKELAHARLGMIAAAGFLAQEAVTKATWSSVYA